jgi:uncharacterized protein YdhG (YjbR/CyaY superfamily)
VPPADAEPAFGGVRRGKKRHEDAHNGAEQVSVRYDSQRPMTNRSTARSIDDYIAEFPHETRKVLQEVRSLVRTVAPDATETMSYAIPTFDLNGKHLVHFAGYAKHVGFYPGAEGIAAFKDELKPFKSAKGSVQFPLDQPMPADLIRRIVAYRVDASTGKA